MEILKPLAEDYEKYCTQFRDKEYWESKVNIVRELCIHKNEVTAVQIAQDFKRRKWDLDGQRKDEQNERKHCDALELAAVFQRWQSDAKSSWMSCQIRALQRMERMGVVSASFRGNLLYSSTSGLRINTVFFWSAPFILRSNNKTGAHWLKGSL